MECWKKSNLEMSIHEEELAEGQEMTQVMDEMESDSRRMEARGRIGMIPRERS